MQVRRSGRWLAALAMAGAALHSPAQTVRAGLWEEQVLQGARRGELPDEQWHQLREQARSQGRRLGRGGSNDQVCWAEHQLRDFDAGMEGTLPGATIAYSDVAADAFTVTIGWKLSPSISGTTVVRFRWLGPDCGDLAAQSPQKNRATAQERPKPAPSGGVAARTGDCKVIGPRTDAVYAGGCRNGWADGEGQQRFPHGGRYRGQWAGGVRQGQGCYIWPDGARYTGEFADHLPHGQRTLVWASGDRYEGQWSRGEMAGYGVFTSPRRGYRYEGQWLHGAYLGRGTTGHERVVQPDAAPEVDFIGGYRAALAEERLRLQGQAPLSFVLARDTANGTTQCFSSIVTIPGPQGWGTEHAAADADAQARALIRAYVGEFERKCGPTLQPGGTTMWLWNKHATGPDAWPPAQAHEDMRRRPGFNQVRMEP